MIMLLPGALLYHNDHAGTWCNTMSHDFIKMTDNIDFLYGFIYECANLINNLYDYNNYDHLAIKLCSEFIMPIINITKKEHIKVYNEHIKEYIR